jgi:rod shape-determining protein MreC
VSRVVKLIFGVVVTIYLVLHVLSFGLRKRETLRAPERIIVWLTSPAQRAMESMLSSIGEIRDHYIALSAAAKSNEQLSAERDQLKAQLLALRETEAQNERLRELLNMGVAQKLRLVAAEKIAVGPSPYERVVRIRRGKSVGIAPGMPVVHPQGVVGQVIEATAETADVLLLVDRSSAIDVISQRSRGRGILRGRSFRQLEFEYLSKGEDIQVGDLLVTSGLDGVYPKGISVGVVTNVEPQDKTKLFVSAMVEPSVEFSQLDEVSVVVGVESPK